jgi:hypothetical protein
MTVVTTETLTRRPSSQEVDVALVRNTVLLRTKPRKKAERIPLEDPCGLMARPVGLGRQMIYLIGPEYIHTGFREPE